MANDETPVNKEEQARIEKLLAETALVNEQLKKVQRENDAAEAEAKTLAGRYWFIPSPKLVFQSIGAGLVLAGAFFFLYQPVIDSVTTVTKEGGTLATLSAKIEAKKNEWLSLENQENKVALEKRDQQLKDLEADFGAKLKKLAEDLKQNKEEKDKAIALVGELTQQLTNLSTEYKAFAQKPETEKEKYVQLAQKAEGRAAELTTKLQSLQDQARAAEKRATQVQEQVERLPFRNSIGMEFLWIPAGKFSMGSDDGDSDERPVHQVTISQPFYLSKYEVTQGQWEAVMGNNPSRFKGDANRPVENVSWNDVQTFIQKLSAKEGGSKYRLPTEAEWEYAARAGSTTVYSFGDHAGQLGEYAWYRDNSRRTTHPVGQLRPNAWGLYDMHGNVWEWVQDRFGKYPADSVTDPPGPASGASRVIRGGSWGNVARFYRSANRGHYAPDFRSNFLGFRLARSGALGS